MKNSLLDIVGGEITPSFSIFLHFLDIVGYKLDLGGHNLHFWVYNGGNLSQAIYAIAMDITIFEKGVSSN